MNNHNKNLVYVSSIKRDLDYNCEENNINSNFFLNFNLCDNTILPRNCKIKISRVKSTYKISKCKKNILINGKNINFDENLFCDSITLDYDLINIPKCNRDKILISVIEIVHLELENILEIDALAYLESGIIKKFKASGQAIDCCDLILKNEICLPYNEYNNDKVYIEFKNCLSTSVEPNFIYLSPIFNCNGNISDLIGNIFINYRMSLEVKSYKEVKANKYIYI